MPQDDHVNIFHRISHDSISVSFQQRSDMNVLRIAVSTLLLSRYMSHEKIMSILFPVRWQKETHSIPLSCVVRTNLGSQACPGYFWLVSIDNNDLRSLTELWIIHWYLDVVASFTCRFRKRASAVLDFEFHGFVWFDDVGSIWRPEKTLDMMQVWGDEDYQCPRGGVATLWSFLLALYPNIYNRALRACWVLSEWIDTLPNKSIIQIL